MYFLLRLPVYLIITPLGRFCAVLAAIQIVMLVKSVRNQDRKLLYCLYGFEALTALGLIAFMLTDDSFQFAGALSGLILQCVLLIATAANHVNRRKAVPQKQQEDVADWPFTQMNE